MCALGTPANPLSQLVAARPFAGCDEGGREQPAEEQPHAGPDQAGLDRIFDEEDAAERERHAADPDGPAGAELFFEALGGLWSAAGGGGGGGGGAAAAGRAGSGAGSGARGGSDLIASTGAAAGVVTGAAGRSAGLGSEAGLRPGFDRLRCSCGNGRCARRARGLRFERFEADFHRPQAVAEIDGLDQRHDGDDRERQHQ